MKCSNCNGSGRQMEDHDGRLGFGPCRDCGGAGEIPDPLRDRLTVMFDLQTRFMQLLKDHDRMPEWPVDLTTKPGQRLIKEVMFNTIGELMEASMTLQNKIHRLSDVRTLDIDHFKEELGDTLAFWMEICILAGFSPDEMFAEYCRKNALVVKRLEDGY